MLISLSVWNHMNRFFFSFLQRLQAPTHLMRIPPSILPWPFWNYSLDEIRCLGAPFSEVAKPQIYTEPNHQQNACFFFGGVFGRILRFTLFYPIVFMGKYPSWNRVLGSIWHYPAHFDLPILWCFCSRFWTQIFRWWRIRFPVYSAYE